MKKKMLILDDSNKGLKIPIGKKTATLIIFLWILGISAIILWVIDLLAS